MTKQILRNLLAEGKMAQVFAELLKLRVTDNELANSIVQAAGRFEVLRRQEHAGTHTHEQLGVERNRITAAMLHIVEQLPDGVIGFSETNNLQDGMEQTHHGSGDNVAGNKIERQINMGAGSTYIENQNNISGKEEPAKEEREETPNAAPSEVQALPESPSGVVGILLGWLPKPFRPVAAIVALGLGCYVGYHYFMPHGEEPSKVETPKVVTTSEKVFVSGVIRINNGEPRLNEITRMTLRNIAANSASVDATGKFTFSGVKIPENKRLLVEVTFADGRVIPTEELIVGEVDKETKTVSLPPLYATRPQAAKSGKPAMDWKIQVNVNTGNGTQNATQ